MWQIDGPLVIGIRFFIALQYVTEKMGGAEGTKLDLDFMEMERVRTSAACIRYGQV